MRLRHRQECLCHQPQGARIRLWVLSPRRSTLGWDSIRIREGLHPARLRNGSISLCPNPLARGPAENYRWLLPPGSEIVARVTPPENACGSWHGHPGRDPEFIHVSRGAGLGASTLRESKIENCNSGFPTGRKRRAHFVKSFPTGRKWADFLIDNMLAYVLA
jgi:hypothetical protein